MTWAVVLIVEVVLVSVCGSISIMLGWESVEEMKVLECAGRGLGDVGEC